MGPNLVTVFQLAADSREFPTQKFAFHSLLTAFALVILFVFIVMKKKVASHYEETEATYNSIDRYDLSSFLSKTIETHKYD